MGAGRKQSKFGKDKKSSNKVADSKKSDSKDGGLLGKLGLGGAAKSDSKPSAADAPESQPEKIGNEHKADGQAQASQQPKPSEGKPAESTKPAKVDKTNEKPPKEVKNAKK